MGGVEVGRVDMGYMIDGLREKRRRLCSECYREDREDLLELIDELVEMLNEANEEEQNFIVKLG